MKSMFIRLGLLALFIAALTGCSGGDDGAPGAQGPAGPTGATGQAGPAGPAGPAAGNNASAMTPAQWASSKFSGQITGLTVGADGKPVVSFKVTDAAGNGVSGLGSTSQAANAIAPGLTNLAFTIAKLVPGTSGSPSRWVSYIVTSMPAKCLATTTGYTAATGCVVAGYPNTPLNGTLPVTPGKPTTDNTGTLVDNGDGTYKYTFYRSITAAKSTIDGLAANALTASANNKVADLDDLTYNASLTHRIGIQLSGNARGTGTNTADGSAAATAAVPLKTPVNITAEIVPATGTVIAKSETDNAKQRRIIDTRNCWSCHGGKMATNNFHGGNELTGAGASRQDPNFCVLCHTDQRKYGVVEMAKSDTVTFTQTVSSTGAVSTTDRLNGVSIKNIPVWIHKIHMGNRLVLQGYAPNSITFNDVGYPQDIRNCAKCHSDNDGATGGNDAPQADNWKNVPSRLACGSCHDGIDFATGTGYTVKQWRAARAALVANTATAMNDYPFTAAKVKAKLLAMTPTGHMGGAHASDAACTLCHTAAVVAAQHIPVTTPTVADANKYASTVTNLPAGAKEVTYDLNSVTLNASRNPVYKFRVLVNGANAVFGTPSATAELMTGFTGSTNLYVTFSTPRDGLTAPADWTANVSTDIRGVFRGTNTGGAAGTLSATPDSSGYYTITHTGSVIPANATNMTGWMGLATGFAQTDVAGYTALNVPAEAKSVVVSGVTGNVARRAIVHKDRCNSCHNRLGVFGMKTFHAGQRNDPQACAICHRPDQSSGGWSSASIAYIHGIHGKDKRTVPFTWHTSNLGDETGNANAFQELGYPGILRNCLQCHLPNTVNFGAQAGGIPALTAAQLTSNMSSKWAYENGNVPYYTVGQNKYPTAGTYNAYAVSGVGAAGTCVPSATATTVLPMAEAVPSPWVTKGPFATTTDYGAGYAYNFATVPSGWAATQATSGNMNGPNGAVTCTNSGVVLPILAPGQTREAAGTTLVNSPITNACFACHTADVATNHMKANGGVLYKARWEVAGAASAAAFVPGTKLPYTEQCIVCHGAGRVADAEAIHLQTMQ